MFCNAIQQHCRSRSSINWISSSTIGQQKSLTRTCDQEITDTESLQIILIVPKFTMSLTCFYSKKLWTYRFCKAWQERIGSREQKWMLSHSKVAIRLVLTNFWNCRTCLTKYSSVDFDLASCCWLHLSVIIYSYIADNIRFLLLEGHLLCITLKLKKGSR